MMKRIGHKDYDDTTMKHFLVTTLLVFTSALGAQDRAELEVVHRIKQEAFERSQVMDHLFYLVEVHGPRLTNSPGFFGAANLAVERMKGWGLDAKLEKWGPYGHGWSYSRFSAHLTKPQYETLIGVPMAWSAGTDGLVKGQPVIAVLKSSAPLKEREALIDAYIEKYRGKLRGKIVLIEALKTIETQNRPMSQRLAGNELSETAEAPQPVPPPLKVDYEDPDIEIPDDPAQRRSFLAHAPRWFREEEREATRKLRYKMIQFLAGEGVRLLIYPASRGDGGTVFPQTAGDYRSEAPIPPPSISLTPEHYNRIYRLVENGIPTEVEVEVEAAFHRDTLDSVNVIGELPGGEKKAEVVMIGAHLDSVGPGLGATDNAAGCAVMMEAMRILKTLNLKLDRTVRIALWGGEEEGLLGSEAYVKEHFGNPETMQLSTAHEALSVYFNYDNGTGKIRGIHLQGNDMARPIFSAWLGPFHDMGAATVSIRNTGGTDHLSFDAVGLPGFQFIQDPVEYDTRTHHSNMDVYDRIQAPDLMQAAAIVASFAYHAANRTEKLPRKPLPEPQPTERPKKAP
jgi:hypothetical protein